MAFPSFDISGKVALVTGADKGIGQGIAAALAHAGVSVAFTTRRLERAAQTVEMIEKQGQPALAVELDVTRLPMIQPAVEQAMQRFGRIDILVNNAGYNFTQTTFEVTEEMWDAVYDTNVKGMFFVTQAVGRIMAQQGGGKVVNIASQAAFAAMPKRVAYCSSKAAVVHMTRVLAYELAQHHILVNAVAPTFVETELTPPVPRRAGVQQVRHGQHRVGSPGDAAGRGRGGVVPGLAGADMVTGHTLLVDAGWTIH